MKCECVDALCSTNHKGGCKKPAVSLIILNRVKSTYDKPLNMCVDCAKFALLFCDATNAKHWKRA